MVTYGIVRSALVCKLLADELVHPLILLVIVLVIGGAHEAWDDEGHGGLAWLGLKECTYAGWRVMAYFFFIYFW